jgi:lathosterol oxidase
VQASSASHSFNLKEAEMQAVVAPVFGPQAILVSFALLFVGGLLFYIIISGSSYLYYCVLRRDRYFPPAQRRTREWAEVKKEWRWSFYNLVGNAALTAPIYVLIVSGRSQVYFDIAEHSVPYFVFSVALLLMLTELLVYWAHRLLHLPALYARFHIHHHQFRTPSPWTSMAFHPLDSFAQAAPHHLCAFLFPVHAGVYFFAIMFLQVWSTFIHERVSWAPATLLNHTAHHTAHHKFNRYNYGQFFTICDRAFGTYKSPVGVVFDGGTQNREGSVEP